MKTRLKDLTFNINKLIRWHPEVGKAPGPNLTKVRSKIEKNGLNVNTKYHPPSARFYKYRSSVNIFLQAKFIFRRVEIFHDSDYLRNVKEAKLKSAQPRRRRTSKVWEGGGMMMTFGTPGKYDNLVSKCGWGKNNPSYFQKSEQHHTPVVARPRSLVLQKVDQDNNNNR